MKKFISNNTEESMKFARDFAGEILARPPSRFRLAARRNLDGGAVALALIGDLGSGKTTFARAFAEALGIKEKIKSPTFVIFRKWKVESGEWKEKFKFFYHFDAYRIHSEKEILNLGWEKIISNPENMVLIEWADKIEKILPKNCLKIKFKHLNGNKREIVS